MVKRDWLIVGLAALAGAGAACQWVAGVQDKQLDPAYQNPSGDAAADGSLEDHATSDAATDAQLDATPETDAPAHARPPSRPIGDAGPSGKGRDITFAARTFYIGSIDPDTDQSDTEAWRQFGFDFDGKCTTADESTKDISGVCHKPLQASKLAHEDGDGCRDNIMGHEIAAALGILPTDFELAMQAQSRSGDLQTLVLRLTDLDDGPDDPYVPAALYVAGPFSSAPLWNGADVPNIDQGSVNDGGIGDPKYVLAGYVKDNVWVSGDFLGPPASLPLLVVNRVIEVPAVTSTLMVQLSADHTKAVRSSFGAVLAKSAMPPVVLPGLLEVAKCDPVIAQALYTAYFEVNQDLASGASDFVVPSATCDLASMGIGIDWQVVSMPAAAIALPPTQGACEGGLPEAGAD